MRIVFSLTITFCLISWAPVKPDPIQSKIKPVLNRKLLILPKIESGKNQERMQQFVDTNLAMKKYQVINKSEFAESMKPTYELIAKEAGTPGFSVIGLPPIIQQLTIRISQSNEKTIDSLSYSVLIFPPQNRKKPEYEDIPVTYLSGKTPTQAIESLLDSLTIPRIGKIIF